MTQAISESRINEGVGDVDYLARARSISSVINSEADAMEAARTITPPVARAIADNGLFWMLVPRSYGGGGQDLVTSMKVVEELSRADGSTGWVIMANAFTAAIAAGFLGPDVASDMFSDGNMAIVAGMFIPVGQGILVDGGYRVTGNYSFGSGAHHASWMGAGFTVCDSEGTPILSADGKPVVRAAFLPRDQVKLLGGWDVMGMVATGSENYSVSDVFVPDAHTIDSFAAVAVRDEPLFRFGLLPLAVSPHAPVALGIAQRALEEIARIVRTKTRPGYPTVVGDSERFRCEFVSNEALLQAARRYVYDVHADAEAALVSGGDLSAEQSARMRQAATWVTLVAQDIVSFAYNWGGSASIRSTSVLGRCLRDISVAAMHMVVEPVALVQAAQPILDVYA